MRHVSMLAFSGGLRMFEGWGRKKKYKWCQLHVAEHQSAGSLYIFIHNNFFHICPLEGHPGGRFREEQTITKVGRQREEVGSET